MQLIDAAESEGRAAWLAGVPAIVEHLEGRWGVRTTAPYQPGGRTAWVAPAGVGLVVKVAWRHPEADHEADGLVVWAGEGAVRLYARVEFSDTMALLLERCVPGTPLAERPASDQDEVIAGLLRRLWRAPGDGRFRSLQTMTANWADEFETKASSMPARTAPFDAGLVRDGLALFRSLPATAERQVLLCTDLHAATSWRPSASPGWSSTPNPTLVTPPTTSSSTCSIARNVFIVILSDSPSAWPG